MRRRPSRRHLLAAAALVVGVSALAGCNGRGGSGLWQRDLEPVVLTGAQVPSPPGPHPGASWRSGGTRELPALAAGAGAGRRAPHRVPHQAPQRHRHHGPADARLLRPGRQRRRRPRRHASTATTRSPSWRPTPGARPGGTGDPAGVVPSSGVRVTVTDPLATSDPSGAAGSGYVYLFVRSGGAPVAGRRQGLRRLRLQPRRSEGPRRELHRLERPVLHALLGPLDARQPAPRHRTRHPRPAPQPVRGRASAAAARTPSRPATAATPPTSTGRCG